MEAWILLYDSMDTLPVIIITVIIVNLVFITVTTIDVHFQELVVCITIWLHTSVAVSNTHHPTVHVTRLHTVMPSSAI